MSRKLVLSISFAIVLLVFVMISYLVIGTNNMSQAQAIAVWFTAGGIVIACGLTFLFAESKPITSTISIIYVVLSMAFGAMELAIFKKSDDVKWTVIIQVVLLAIYVIGCLLAGSSTNKNDYDKDENGKNIYKKAG